MNFPIVRTVVSYNHAYEKRLEEGDIASCHFCGEPIVLNKKNVYEAEDGMPIVICPHEGCRHRVPILYYFDKTERTKNRLRKPLRQRNGAKTSIRKAYKSMQ